MSPRTARSRTTVSSTRLGVRRLVPLVLGALLLSGVAACSDDEEASVGADPSIEEALALVPASVLASDGAQQVAVGRVARATELAGAERPGAEATGPEVREHAIEVYGSGTAPVAVVAPSALNEWVSGAEEVAEEAGFTPADVDWFVEAGTPPNALTVLGLRDGAGDRVASVLGDQEDGIWKLGPAEDLQVEIRERTALRPLGESLRLGWKDGRLVMSRTVPGVRAGLAPDGDSLAEHAIVGPLARGLDRAEAYTAQFVLDADFSVLAAGGSRPVADPEDSEAQLEALEQEALPAPFLGVAVGNTFRKERAAAVFVYQHASEEAAEQNAAAFGELVAAGRGMTARPWAELFAADEVETEVEGPTLVVVVPYLDDVPVGTAQRVLTSRDTLVSHRLGR